MRQRRVGILGAGIMGTSLALMLARRGAEISVFDRERAPMGCASRWNEGKIHLGYLYAADPTMHTAQLLIPGGLLFGHLVSELIGSDVAQHCAAADDIYLVHRQSVVDARTVRARFDAVSAMLAEHPDAGKYLADVSNAQCRQLSQGELAAIADPREIVAAFEVPERSVDTQWVADRLSEALLAEPMVSVRTGTTVARVVPADDDGSAWRVIGTPNIDERFDIIVNALWEGRLEIDATAGIVPDYEWSHRYRLAVFARTRMELSVRSAIVCVGPFGDVKNYNGRDFYLSWYPTGLVAEGSETTLARPKPLPPEQEIQFIGQVREGLGNIIPAARAILDAAEETRIRGGFVFAKGTGSLADRNASLHRRDRFGVLRAGTYYSIDTGKYSTAPWLAETLAREICEE